jgi:hypothetical protein
MKKMINLMIGVIIFLSISFASNIDLNMPKVHTISDFENGTIQEEPEWWTFGNMSIEPVGTQMFSKDPLNSHLGKFALALKGKTKDWYVGGLGTYVGIDATRYTHLKMLVYGTGPKSGRLTIQMYDDDNKNWVLEQDIENNYIPIFDDLFEYTQTVDWRGWRVLLIPFANFKDVNPTVGDNVFNPSQQDASGGLLHFQFIVLADDKEGTVDMAINDIKLVDMARD